MTETTVGLGPLRTPVRTLWNVLCWPLRQMAGTSEIKRNVDDLRVHMTALTEIMHIVVAQLAGDWSPEQRERVQRAIANFKIVNQGLGSIVPSGNPVTKAELERLRQYTQRAELGEPFSPEEARDFKELAEKATKDYASAEWASELLKVALFVFALYALSELLKPQKKAS